MNNSNAQDDFAAAVRPHPLVGGAFALAIVGTTTLTILAPIKSPLTKNWLLTVLIASSLLLALFWAIPSWAPRTNKYLWTASKSVLVTYSAAVALASYFLAILVCIVLFSIASWRYHTMTEHWGKLWLLALISGVFPMLIGIYLLLQQAGATKRFKWLNASRLLTPASKKDQFNDRGRLFILLVATIEIAMIQGAIVLTGGLSISPFTVLLVLVGTVAALASERPIYALFTVLLACQAGAATEVIGSYEPHSKAFFPAAHIVILFLSMLIGLLIDLGRKSKPNNRRSASRRTPPK